MKVINLDQNTEEWLEWRRDKLMASDAAVAMNDHKYKSRAQLRREQIHGKEPVSARTQEIFDYGHEMEAKLKSRSPYDQFAPLCIESDDGMFGASLDGWHEPSKSVMEVKAPFNQEESPIYLAYEAWQEEYERAYIASERIERDIRALKMVAPPYIFWQMVQQAQLSSCEYMMYTIVLEGMIIKMVRLSGAALREFWPQLKMGWGDYMQFKHSFDNVDEDMFNEYKKAHVMLDAARKDLETAKANLIAECGKGVEGSAYGVTIKQQERAGNVDVDKMLCEEFGAPEQEVSAIKDRYRGKPSRFTKITVRKDSK